MGYLYILHDFANDGFIKVGKADEVMDRFISYAAPNLILGHVFEVPLEGVELLVLEKKMHHPLKGARVEWYGLEWYIMFADEACKYIQLFLQDHGIAYTHWTGSAYKKHLREHYIRSCIEPQATTPWRNPYFAYCDEPATDADCSNYNQPANAATVFHSAVAPSNANRALREAVRAAPLRKAA